MKTHPRSLLHPGLLCLAACQTSSDAYIASHHPVSAVGQAADTNEIPLWRRPQQAPTTGGDCTMDAPELLVDDILTTRTEIIVNLEMLGQDDTIRGSERPFVRIQVDGCILAPPPAEGRVQAHGTSALRIQHSDLPDGEVELTFFAFGAAASLPAIRRLDGQFSAVESAHRNGRYQQGDTVAIPLPACPEVP